MAANEGYTSRLMTTRRTQTLLQLILVLITAPLLAGCRGSGPGGDDTRPTPISGAPQAAEGGGSADQGGGVGQAITLRLWTQRNDTFDAAYRALADAYTAANPGVTVVVEPIDVATFSQTVQDALVAGTSADVIQMAGGTLCIYSAQLSPAPDPIMALNPQGAFDPLVLGGFTCDGALYGLPQEAAVPWGLAVSRDSDAAGGVADGGSSVAWDFVRFATLDPANAAAWNAATSTAGVIKN
jgi:ABC-type glycerol-3-phosphate transport system substrate-binding protein